MKTKKEKYCRACGADHGHTFVGCKNAGRLREIIQNQDHELDVVMARAVKAEAALIQAETQAKVHQHMTRMVFALLELTDLQREAMLQR